MKATMALRAAAMFIVFAAMTVGWMTVSSADDVSPAGLIAIPADHDNDLKFYAGDGSIVTGSEALTRMRDASLTLWIAGNQFFAMDKVIGDFQHSAPGSTVGLITLPPGLILSAILGGGWSYKGQDYRATPDIYASVNSEHLKKLKAAGLMSRYAVYMHNELQIMVAKNNPKHIAGIDDLVRDDVRTSMPNPVSEGIMQFYARKVLDHHGIWQRISGGKECVACQTTPNNWFTAVHHRETSQRILDGKSDAGIVWKTEIQEARRAGAEVDAVELTAFDSLRNEVSYAIGALDNSKHKQVADRYLAFVTGPDGQAAYVSFGFVGASASELQMKPIE
jgi:ABC-type molybdate transport system substrate-binding protein